MITEQKQSNSEVKGRVKVAKNSKQMERHFKGIANHKRIDILLIVSKEKNLTVEQITENLDANFKTVSEHTRRLVQAGLLEKKYVGRNVIHKLSPYGEIIVKFIKTFRHS
jgi:DNA-binding transcriptional ArsR family regulator